MAERPHKLTLSHEVLQLMLADLRDLVIAVKTVPHAASFVCSTLAIMIASAGPDGSGPQLAMMRAVEAAGFTPEYYAGTIRVSYFPPPPLKGRPGRSAKGRLVLR